MTEHAPHEEFEEIPFLGAVMTMLNYALLTIIAHIRDFLRKVGIEAAKVKVENPKNKVCVQNFRAINLSTHRATIAS